MDAPPGPLRSPDGLHWWDGKAWQPIATLGVPPPPAAVPSAPAAAAEPAREEAPSGGAWQPPPEFAQPPPLASQATEEVPREGPWQAPPAPPVETPAAAASAAPLDPWQPPPGVAGQAPSAPPPAPLPEASPQPAAVSARPAPQPAAVSSPPGPVPGPPPAPAPAPPEAGVPWPNWLPRDERSEAAVEGVPTRVARTATKPPPAAPTAVSLPAGARPSSWMDRLYPAAAAVTSNRRIAIYAGVGVLGLIALYVLFQALSQANLFGSGLGGSSPTDTGPVGTQFQQADGFLSGSLNPALSSVATAVKPIAVDCTGTHSVTCRNTVQDADLAMAKAISVIDRGTFPSCISASLVQTRRDLAIQEQALKAALIGFRANNDDLITRGLADYAAAAPALKADGDALKAVEQTACPKTS